MVSRDGDDAVKTVEMTAEELEYHTNFADKAMTGFEKIDSNL